MIRRLLWLGIGVGVGVTVVSRAQRAARSLAPDALAARGARSARGFWGDVRAGMREREEQLTDALGLGDDEEVDR